ncbi:MAG: hypothetical protein RSB78_04465 [Oscillospiraceae bacterium]
MDRHPMLRLLPLSVREKNEKTDIKSIGHDKCEELTADFDDALIHPNERDCNKLQEPSKAGQA